MNLDKKLAKYARQLDNPKYFPIILDILEKADKTGYQFKNFNLYDLELITSNINDYYKAITTPEEDERMIRYCNKTWFIVSDKNYILLQTESFWHALQFYFKGYFLLHLAKVLQTLSVNSLICADNVNNDIWMIRGAIKTSKFLHCTIFDLEEYNI